MKSVLVLGCGRSGTSMAAGTLAGAGYFMGERLHPARPSNPKGFYELGEINQINEALLAPLTAAHDPDLREGQRWLAELRPGAIVRTPPRSAVKRIRKAVANRPFCFKDPQFCYTLPIWRGFLQDTVFLCVFRNPASVAQSIVKECADMPNLHNVHMTPSRAMKIWSAQYEWVLSIHRHAGAWMFMEFDQFLDPAAVDRLSNFVEARLDGNFPEPALQRTPADGGLGTKVSAIYQQLQALSNASVDPACGDLR